MPTYQHSLGDVITALNAKIADLTGAKNTVKEKINAGKSVSQNTAVLEEIIESLEAAENAKLLLQNSCCSGQNCDFEYFDGDPAE